MLCVKCSSFFSPPQVHPDHQVKKKKKGTLISCIIYLKLSLIWYSCNVFLPLGLPGRAGSPGPQGAPGPEGRRGRRGLFRLILYEVCTKSDKYTQKQKSVTCLKQFFLFFKLLNCSYTTWESHLVSMGDFVCSCNIRNDRETVHNAGLMILFWKSKTLCWQVHRLQ